jgi:replication factor A1
MESWSLARVATLPRPADDDVEVAEALVGAFADGESPETGTERSETESGGQTTTTEFTGTVVQTGDPVVLDNGTETMKVETDSHLQLGEEVTARGERDGERLDADEIL